MILRRGDEKSREDSHPGPGKERDKVRFIKGDSLVLQPRKCMPFSVA